MTLYRYRAIPAGGGRAAVRVGELAAESPAELRAALRRIGLQVIDARPVSRRAAGSAAVALAPFRDAWAKHLRARRIVEKTEVYDSLATMLEAGLPLAEAFGTLVDSGAGARRRMLADLLERVRAGEPLDAAMSAHREWYDGAEAAMVRAGHATGELPAVLRSLAQRHERAGSLTSRIVAALTYPMVVLTVGVGVVVFLSARTLPELTAILTDAGVPVPTLTRAVIAFGVGVRAWGPYLLVTFLLLGLLGLWARPMAARFGLRAPGWCRALTPRFMRSARLARALDGIAELARTGVPLVDALRIVAPTVGGSLATALCGAAHRIERGESLTHALDDPVWFSAECTRLIAIGETSGELAPILAKLAARAERSATRAVDRLTALLEPAVILLLAALIGLVVMGAVLPLVRLQEVIG